MLTFLGYYLSLLTLIYSFILAVTRYFTNEQISLFDSLNEIFLHFSFFSLSVFYINTFNNILTIFLSILILYRSYIKYVYGIKYKIHDLSGKVYIVTGCNTGIGYETVRALVAMNATVIMACRSISKAQVARESIIKASKCSPSKLVCLTLDLCDFNSVREFVKEFIALGFPLHCLINNAGVIMDSKTLTSAGLETTITANHLSHFLLTNLLIPELAKTKGRVVVLSSSLYLNSKFFNFENFMSEKSYKMFDNYSQSKLANVLFCLELQRRMEKQSTGVTCNIVHPGIVKTEVTRNMNFFMKLGDAVSWPILIFIQKTGGQGAFCSVHVATSPDLNNSGGKYYFNCKSIPLNSVASDESTALKLWNLSEKYVGL